MLECIKNDYLAQKARFEQMCREEVAAQKAKADRELIEPKCQDYEKAKAESIRTAQAAYVLSSRRLRIMSAGIQTRHLQ